MSSWDSQNTNIVETPHKTNMMWEICHNWCTAISIHVGESVSSTNSAVKRIHYLYEARRKMAPYGYDNEPAAAP